MPKRFDAEAAQTAAATFPRATEVKAIELCTVEGRQQRNSIPAPRPGVSRPLGRWLMPRPKSGKSAKVLASTVMCRRQ